MNLKLFLTGLIVAAMTFSPLSADDVTVLPQPNAVTPLSGSINLSARPVVAYTAPLKSEATLLKEFLKEDFATDAQLKKNADNAQIRLIIDAAFPDTVIGAYELVAEKDFVQIKGRTPAGVFYGIQTLRQLLRREGNTLHVSKTHITDAPAFTWRAFMLDEARYFKGKQVVLDLLDRMAELKMNVFHWHLTDDQGWRIEIKKYPELTRVGAFRDSSEINHFHSNVYDGKPHGGFYTQKDIKEIVRYAAARHITVVPEIEMPGHASAAIAAYPRLGTTGEKIKVPCNYGVHYNAYNVADERVIDFLHNVLDEVMTLFPSQVIHIGGDELRYNAWKASSQVQNYMKEKGIATPAGLQVFFTNSISRYLASKQRNMMGWNEITGDQVNSYQQDGSGTADHKLADGTIVHFWSGKPQLIKETLLKGYKMVNSYSQYTYLDYSYRSIPLKKAYGFRPIPDGLSAEQQKQVLGLGCQMWGEFIPTVEKMNYMIYPRIAAYAEVGWTRTDNKDYDRFVTALSRFVTRWKKSGIQPGPVE